MSLFKILFFVSNILGYIPLLSFFKKVNNKFKGLNFYIFLVAFSSFYELVFSYFLKFNVEIWFKVFSLLEFILIMQIFIYQKYRPKIIFFIFFFLFYMIVYLYILIYMNNYHFLLKDSFLNLIVFVFILLFSFFWLMKSLKSSELITYTKIPFFYFLSGLIIYYVGIIFLSIFSLEIIKSDMSINQYWLLNIFFLIVFRIFIIISVWKQSTV